MTMITRGRMLRESYRIISARGNCKVLTESDFCLLPSTQMYDFWQESQVNLYIMLEHNEAGSLSLNRKNDEILNELLKQNLNSI